MGMTKGRNGKDLREAEEMKVLMTQMTPMLEPDILECEIKWALGIITLSKVVEVMEFKMRYFRS